MEMGTTGGRTKATGNALWRARRYPFARTSRTFLVMCAKTPFPLITGTCGVRTLPKNMGYRQDRRRLRYIFLSTARASTTQQHKQRKKRVLPRILYNPTLLLAISEARWPLWPSYTAKKQGGHASNFVWASSGACKHCTTVCLSSWRARGKTVGRGVNTGVNTSIFNVERWSLAAVSDEYRVRHASLAATSTGEKNVRVIFNGPIG